MCATQLDEQARREVDEVVDGATLHDYLLLEGDWAHPGGQASTAPVEAGENQEAAQPVLLQAL
jgi:hypothetical protein